MKKLDAYKEYCTGCGLCGSVCSVGFEIDEKGFPQPSLEEKDTAFCDSICQASGKLWEDQSGNIWGDYKHVYFGWSEDEYIKQQASSGGVLTAMCLYLLEEDIVDGVIQTRKARAVPYATETVISTTREDVLRCMGSRYSISSPLMDIKQIVELGKKYCFVGKPCDVYALKAYMKQDKELAEMIPFTMSFFCAGMPSVDAQKKLLTRLESSDEQCADLRYRGDGWPGFATATNKDGEKHQITYDESWGKILGRDVRKACRFCIDGIGVFADIACGDAWYLKDGKPDFSEADGRNVVFARSDAGVQLLEGATEKRYIHLDNNNEAIKNLALIQKYQMERKATMGAMLSALRVCGKPTPSYPRKIVAAFSTHASTKAKLKRFAGSLKRIAKGKM